MYCVLWFTPKPKYNSDDKIHLKLILLLCFENRNTTKCYIGNDKQVPYFVWSHELLCHAIWNMWFKFQNLRTSFKVWYLPLFSLLSINQFLKISHFYFYRMFFILCRMIWCKNSLQTGWHIVYHSILVSIIQSCLLNLSHQ